MTRYITHLMHRAINRLKVGPTIWNKQENNYSWMLQRVDLMHGGKNINGGKFMFFSAFELEIKLKPQTFLSPVYYPCVWLSLELLWSFFQ